MFEYENLGNLGTAINKYRKPSSNGITEIEEGTIYLHEQDKTEMFFFALVFSKLTRITMKSEDSQYLIC